MRTRDRLLGAIAAVTLIGALMAAFPGGGRAADSGHYLPAPAGTQLIVTQGQDTPPDHNAANHSQYAWDFGIAGNGEFDVTAVGSGTIIGLRDNSTAHCYPDSSCWKDANYIVLDLGRGTSALYVHLATGSAVVKVGDPVARGQKLAKDDNTGFSSGNHLHFMFETTPTVPNIPAPGPSDMTTVAWWWTNSLDIAFADAGVPIYGRTYTSGNTPSATPTRTPAPPLKTIQELIAATHPATTSSAAAMAIRTAFEATPSVTLASGRQVNAAMVLGRPPTPGFTMTTGVTVTCSYTVGPCGYGFQYECAANPFPWDPLHSDQNRASGCVSVLYDLFSSYRATANGSFYEATLAVYNYAVHALPAKWANYVINPELLNAYK
jgi:hypothetical protein